MIESITYNGVTFCDLKGIAGMSLPLWLQQGMRFFRFSRASEEHKQKDLQRVWELAQEVLS